MIARGSQPMFTSGYQVFHNSSLGLRVKGKAGISDMHGVRTAEKKSMMRIQSVFEVSRLLGGHG